MRIDSSLGWQWAARVASQAEGDKNIKLDQAEFTHMMAGRGKNIFISPQQWVQQYLINNKTEFKAKRI